MPEELSWEVIIILIGLVISLIGWIYKSQKKDIETNEKRINAIHENFVKKDDFKEYRKDLKHDLHEFKVHVTTVVNKVESDLKIDISELKDKMDKIYDIIIKEKA